MLILGILTGFYSYAILILGLFGKINYINIATITLFFLISTYFISKNKLPRRTDFINFLSDKNNSILIILLIILSVINLIGALGPEIAFDATWYHLTIPKIFIENKTIFFIQDNVFYYSLMPKLSEMLYLSSLVLANEILAKFIHYLFGILTTIVVYKIARIYLNRYQSLFASMIFYSNLVVAWLSITAYVDLTRAFYEALAFYYLLLFTKGKLYRNLVFSAVLLGFAASTKVLSILTLPIFLVVILLVVKINLSQKIKLCIIFTVITLLIPLPWFLISYYYSGNPFYPLFTKLTTTQYELSLLEPQNLLFKLYKFLIIPADPVSPVYLLVFPIFIIGSKEFIKKYLPIFIFIILSLIILTITPVDGGARFVVPFLTVFSVAASIIIFKFTNKSVKKILIILVIIIFAINTLYRGLANLKFIPVLLGTQTKQEFLMENLNFEYGDFYDENDEIYKIVGDSNVLLLGMHNLYYVDFNFTLEEWNQNDYQYILVQKGLLPSHYEGQMVYQNKKTNVNLYKVGK